VLRELFAIDRVSIARLTPDRERFEIAADAGASLLAPGTSLPVGTCSYFSAAAEGRSFHEPDFDVSQTFRRPLDSVVLATGFHAGCSAPIGTRTSPLGVVSLSARAPRPDMGNLTEQLDEVAGLLADVLTPARIDAVVRLTPREDELLESLDEGLRFKQIARRLGISEATAKTHGRNLFRKLDATSRAEAVHSARVRGLLA
jgi:DNA-binding CsgD family transcriptional regulator